MVLTAGSWDRGAGQASLLLRPLLPPPTMSCTHGPWGRCASPCPLPARPPAAIIPRPLSPLRRPCVPTVTWKAQVLAVSTSGTREVRSTASPLLVLPDKAGPTQAGSGTQTLESPACPCPGPCSLPSSKRPTGVPRAPRSPPHGPPSPALNPRVPWFLWCHFCYMSPVFFAKLPFLASLLSVFLGCWDGGQELQPGSKRPATPGGRETRGTAEESIPHWGRPRMGGVSWALTIMLS